MSKPPLPDPLHGAECARLVEAEKEIAMLRDHLEWALERVEPNADDEADMDAYHDRWNNCFGLIQ